jgi:hypothetical protein
MIRIDDHRNREHIGVRENLEVNGHVPALADSDRNRSCDLVPAKHHWLDRTADVRYERVESVLVVHVVAVDPKSREQAEQPTQNRDRCWTTRCRLVGSHERLNLPETFGNAAASWDVDKQWADKIPECRSAARPATGNRHGDGNWVDKLSSALQYLMQRPADCDQNGVIGGGLVPMCRCGELSAIQPDNRHLTMGTGRLHQRAGCSARRVQASAREHPAA